MQNSTAPTWPCIDKMMEDIGGGFSMGLISSGVWGFIRGVRNAPSGDGLRNGLFLARDKGLEGATSFAMYGGMFAATDCAVTQLRRGHRDVWTGIISGAVTGAVLQVRNGVKPMVKSALSGALMLASVEAIGQLTSKMLSKQRPITLSEDAGTES